MARLRICRHKHEDALNETNANMLIAHTVPDQLEIGVGSLR